MRSDDVTCRFELDHLEPRRLFSAVPAISIGDVSVIEGNAGTKTAAVVVRLDQTRSHPTVTVNYATQNGTALAGADYAATSGSLTFGANEYSKVILVPVIGDHLAESDESFFVNLQGVKGAKLADGQGIVRIADDEPRISIADESGQEGNSGTTPFNIIVNLSSPYDQPVTVNFNTQDATAVAGMDYVATAGSVTFAAGQTSKAIQVPVTGDRIAGADQYFLVNIQGTGNAHIGRAQGIVTILDDEPRITFQSAANYEGDDGTTSFNFTVNLSGPYGEAVTVNFNTQDSSAFAGVDYLVSSGTLTFAPGETSQPITVQVIGNTTPEPEKDFSIMLSGASANALVSSSGYGAILDDDGYVDPYYDPNPSDYNAPYPGWVRDPDTGWWWDPNSNAAMDPQSGTVFYGGW